MKHLYRFLKRLSLTGRIAVACGIVMAGSGVLLYGGPFFSNASNPPFGTGSAFFEMQFVRNASDVDLILGEAPSLDRETMRIKLGIDTVFIASWAGLLMSLGWITGGALGSLAAVCGATAGAADLLVNRAILKIVDVPLKAVTPAMIDAVRYASVARWTLVALALILLAVRKYQLRGPTQNLS